MTRDRWSRFRITHRHRGWHVASADWGESLPWLIDLRIGRDGGVIIIGAISKHKRKLVFIFAAINIRHEDKEIQKGLNLHDGKVLAKTEVGDEKYLRW